MKSKQNQIKIIFRPSRALPPPPCIGELSHVRVMMADAWKTLKKKSNGKADQKRSSLRQSTRALPQQPFTGCIQAAIEMEGRFPFSPKFRKLRLEIKWNGPVTSHQHFSRWFTLTSPVIRSVLDDRVLLSHTLDV